MTIAKLFDSSPLPRVEIQILLTHVLGKNRAFVLAHPELILTKTQEKTLHGLVEQRLKNEPLAYILGEKEFYGLVFKVTPDTLIPRPETEDIIELTSQFLKVKKLVKPIIFEIGTGSGAIAIILAKKFPDSTVIANDISKAALKVAEQNAKALGVRNVEFILGSLLEPFKVKPDMIVTNLPYISRHIYENLEPQIRDFEPEIALVGGETGLELYEKLFEQVDQFFPGTPVLYEVDGRIYQKN